MFDDPIISACNLSGNIVASCAVGSEMNSTVFTSQLVVRAEMVGGSGSPAPTSEHNDLTGRDAEECHPQSAITGLATALSGKVDKETGKGLSANDYTTAEKSKLAGIEAGAQVNPDLSGYALTSDVNIALGGKVDKVTGKDLSTNDFTNDLKALLEQLGNESDPCKVFIYDDHMTGRMSATASANGNPSGVLFATTGGSVNSSAVAQGTNKRGVWVMSTSTSNNTNFAIIGYLNCLLTDGSIVMGSFVKTHTSLSSSTQRYIVISGLMDDIAASANHCRFVYSDNINSGKWQIETMSASSGNTVDSTVAVVADTWYKLQIIINSTATEVKYYINNVLVATVVDNIPVSIMHFMTVLNKTIGSTARTLSVDRHYLKQIFNVDVC